MNAFPDPTVAAVSLTFDDGLSSHLEQAIPRLERLGLRGTFYATAGDEAVLERFRAARDAGHEIGNHTIPHPWPATHVMSAGARGVEDLSLDDMRAELDQTIARFGAVFSDACECSYAYPGYATWVGRGARARVFTGWPHTAGMAATANRSAAGADARGV